MTETPTTTNGQNGKDSFTITVGNMSATVKGFATIFVVSVAAIIASNLYAGNEIKKALENHNTSTVEIQARELKARGTQWDVINRIEQDRREQNDVMRQKVDLQICMQMFETSERKVIRQKQGGWWEACPWLERPKLKQGLEIPQ